MNISNLFNKNSMLLVLLSCFQSELTQAASHNISDSNPFLTSESEELRNELTKEKLLKIYFSGNLAGAKESCGCALNPKGGLERRYNFLKKEGLLEKKRPENTLVLDFGNLLFKNENITQYDKKSVLKNAQKMIQASNLFKYDAINFGNLDRGVPQEDLQKFFGDSRFPWITTNLFPNSRFGNSFKKRLGFKLQNFDIVILGLSSSLIEELPKDWRMENPKTALLNELKNTPDSTLPIVLSDLEVGELTKIAEETKRPVIFLGSREMGGWDRPLEIGQSLLLHLRHQGQEWGLLKVSSKWQTKQGWYNTLETEALAKRWESLKNETLKINELENSQEKNTEIRNLKNKANELKALAPSSKKDIPFSYETIEMNSSFQGKNLVTPFMK